MLDQSAVRAYIDKHRDRRHSNKVLHGHPSPVFWNESEVSIPDVMRQRAEADARVPKRLNLYVGTPYCLPTEPDRCGFCLFPSEVYRDRQQLDVYLRYLRREGELFRRHLGGTELASIYFGGGTSNLYRADQYEVLMGIVGEVFEIPPGIEVTLEGIPQTFSAEKLAAMKASGVTRISMGVQQLDDELIKASGRRQKSEQVFQAIEWCRQLDLPISIDLIFGWPGQTVGDMLADLTAMADAGVSHITNYELNVAGRTNFSRHRRHELPSATETLEMYRQGKALLESRGYVQVTPYDFERVSPDASGAYLYEALFRRPFRREHGRLVGFDAWGWGYAGISFFFGTPSAPGWAYLNQVHIDAYYRALDRGHYPVMRGFHYTRTDLRLHLLFQELQGLAIDRGGHAALFNRDVVEDFRPLWTTLEELGWASVDRTRVSITGDGVFYLPVIQDLLALERTEEMRRRRRADGLATSAPAEPLLANGAATQSGSLGV